MELLKKEKSSFAEASEDAKELKLRAGEKITRIVNHHPIVVIPHLAVCLLILILNFFLMYFLFLQGWWGALLFAAVIFIVAFYVFRLFFLYRHNLFVITNQRIVDFEQAGFFEKFINEYPYAKIERAEAGIKGIGPTLFRYGNLKLYVASGDLDQTRLTPPIELYKVAKPRSLQNLINEYLSGQEPAVPAEQTSAFVEKPVSHEIERASHPAGQEKPIDRVMQQVESLSKEDKEEVIRLLEQELQDARD